MHLVKAKGILSSQNTMNLYRGCSHGCIYCDARSECYHMEHDFEDIAVKENALDLLEYALRHKRKKCIISTGAMTDPYIPLEMKLGHVRKALQLIDSYGFGVTIQTKSDRILRDLDLLQKINEKTKCVVQMTLTTYDETLCKKLEPHVSTTSERVAALKQFRDAGIPTVVWLTPILPFINDTQDNISGILDLCADAKVYGVICFGMGLTLRAGNRAYFYKQLDRLFPQLKEKYIQTYADRYVVESPNQGCLMTLLKEKCKKSGILYHNQQIFQYLRSFTEKDAAPQLCLWNFQER